MSIPSECSGYKVAQLKFDESSEVVHYVFMREHNVRERCEEKPSDRTLFIIGTPPFVTEEGYMNAFEKFGKVSHVIFQPCPSSSAPQKNISQFFEDHPEVKGFKVAYVVFENATSLNKAMLASSDEPLILSTATNPISTGIAKWTQEYNKMIVEPEKMQEDIDAFMINYDKEVKEAEMREKEEMEPDDEGWVKVTRKGRKPGFARKESVHNKIMKKESQKRSKKQLLNFYRFQIRQSKMNHLVQLREKFEEDKKKIEVMKQSRKFKPF